MEKKGVLPLLAGYGDKNRPVSEGQKPALDMALDGTKNGAFLALFVPKPVPLDPQKSCNACTTRIYGSLQSVSDSVCEGSNPSSAAK